MLWIWPVVTVAVIGVVLLLVTSELASSTRGRVERTFVCPVSGKDVSALFDSDFFAPGHYRDVLACSRFAPGTAVACGKDCLAMSKETIAEQDAVRLPVWIG